MAAKGGLVSDITPGDCMELLDCCRHVFSYGSRTNRHSSFVYQLSAYHLTCRGKYAQTCRGLGA
jgi:hypothetical protein